jgi:hypothetical protein
MQEKYKREELEFESSRGLQPHLQENEHQKPRLCNAQESCTPNPTQCTSPLPFGASSPWHRIACTTSFEPLSER